MARCAPGLLRVAHPFPSALDAIATVAIAAIAGTAPSVAARLGLGMLLLQAIGVVVLGAGWFWVLSTAGSLAG